MININKEHLKIEGDVTTILTEIAVMIHTILADNLIPEKLLREAVEEGFTTVKEIKGKIKKELLKSIKEGNFEQVLEDFIENIGENENDI